MARDVIDLLEQGFAWTAERVAQVEPEDLDTPTPCEGWQLRDLLDHMLGSLEQLAAAAEGDQDDAAGADQSARRDARPQARAPGEVDDPSGDDVPGEAEASGEADGPSGDEAQRPGDRLGDDCGQAAFAAVRQRAMSAWRRPGVMAGTCELPLGTVPAPAAAHINLVEVVVHGWDVSQAMGEAAAIPAELAEPMLAFSRQAVDPARGRAFGPDLAVGDAVGDRLVAFLGRKP